MQIEYYRPAQSYRVPLLVLCCAGLAAAQVWTPLKNQPTTFAPVASLLLTDGTVIVEDANTCTNFLGIQVPKRAASGSSLPGPTSTPTPLCEWYKLTPDLHGSYINGTWTQIASMPPGYGPLYFGSAVLADSRVVVQGGEYDFGESSWTPQGAIYNPVTNTWSEMLPPEPPAFTLPWENIGDAQSAVLPNGKWLLADAVDFTASATDNDRRVALLDPATLTWSNPGSANKLDSNDEEGWTLLRDGTILTVDAANAVSGHYTAERYIPSLGQWISAGMTPHSLVDASSQELGPAVLRPDGTVFYMGATKYTAIYHPGGHLLDPGTWTAGPNFPMTSKGQQLDIADGPAALLPNGHVLMMTSPGVYQTGAVFFEFDGTNLHEIPGVPNSAIDSSYYGRMLELPTGQILFTDGSTDVEIYTPGSKPAVNPAWAPVITTVPATMQRGQTYTISGKQFNGLSQGAAYGDDAQSATNYPLIRVRNCATQHVFYFRTHDHSTMAVATGNAIVSTKFDVPANMERGHSDLWVVTNGIASAPVLVFIP